MRLLIALPPTLLHAHWYLVSCTCTRAPSPPTSFSLLFLSTTILFRVLDVISLAGRHAAVQQQPHTAEAAAASTAEWSRTFWQCTLSPASKHRCPEYRCSEYWRWRRWRPLPAESRASVHSATCNLTSQSIPCECTKFWYEFSLQLSAIEMTLCCIDFTV